MDPTTFDAFSTLLYQHAGMNVPAGKELLVAARVGKRMRALGLDDPGAYLRLLQADGSGAELVRFLDVMSTNVTRFFREPPHFELLRELVDGWRSRGRTRVRIWSAASSTGEEPYTIAMTLVHHWPELSGGRCDVKVLATDISTRVLAAARAARYPAKALGDVPPPYRDRYFTAPPGQPGTREVVDQVRRLVTFRRLNLSAPPFPMRGPFDVVFCRNVMIYFDTPVRTGLIGEVERLLAPGGVLLIGHSENLLGVPTRGLRSVAPSVYRNEAAAPAGRPESEPR